ncbi:MAG: hypothetical protein DME65_15200 [Verrucomicrobia bacterium]|nr:MAG: hypothetical protein DME65_15200 [Verrucomicrobiota bacterium]
MTDEAAAEVRPTFDVDAIAEITSYLEYTTFGERLHKLGFTEDASEGAPICRWRNGEIKLDLMPLDEHNLGFSNRWYKPAMDAATELEIEPGLRIRVVYLWVRQKRIPFYRACYGRSSLWLLMRNCSMTIHVAE